MIRLYGECPSDASRTYIYSCLNCNNNTNPFNKTR
nr:MAG TPA: hypothetical protein [Caudoviricetes sp.]